MISGAIFARLNNRKKKAAVAPAQSPAPSATHTTSDELPEEDLVLIAAAVSLMLGHRPHRLVSIRPPAMDWSREGRRQHLMSHKL
jgi:hypothetical protein